MCTVGKQLRKRVGPISGNLKLVLRWTNVRASQSSCRIIVVCSLCVEVGQCKSVTILLSLLAFHKMLKERDDLLAKYPDCPTLMKENRWMDEMRWVIRSYQRVKGVFEDCEDLAKRKQRALHLTLCVLCFF